MTQGYCVRCRKKVNINNATRITMKNGRKAIKGTCSRCGGKVFRIGA